MAVESGDGGQYHADNGDAFAHFIRSHGDEGDTIAVLSDGDHGSGLDAGWNIRQRSKRGDKTGEWTPDE